MMIGGIKASTWNERINITNDIKVLNKYKKSLERKNINTDEGDEKNKVLHLLEVINEKIKTLGKKNQVRLPDILKKIKEYLQDCKFVCENNKEFDGRTNSCIDESKIINTIMKDPYLRERVKKPLKNRHWFDISARDDEFGDIPINIKTTTMQTADNSGNLAILLQSLTDYNMNIEDKYNNGYVSKILLQKLQKQEYNTDYKKDYYFLVVNKKDPSDIVINSILGLSKITTNIYNLPFQIRWMDNREYKLQDVQEKVKTILKNVQDTKPSWEEKFFSEFKKLKIVEN